MEISGDMENNADWIPREADLSRPNPARMYDYLLGGFHNFEIDRTYAEKAISAFPETGAAAKVNRAFLRRAVQCLVGQGITQFIDFGSGIPTVGHVHEIAQRTNPDARVIYVDIDPVAVAHSEAILKGRQDASIIMADAREPEKILLHEKTQRLLDLNKPIAVLFVAVLHFLTQDDQANEVIDTVRKMIVPGSYLCIAHPSYEGAPKEVRARYEQIAKAGQMTVKHRMRTEIEPFFSGLELIEPGLVFAPQWQPESPDDLLLSQPELSLNLVGVGRKP